MLRVMMGDWMRPRVMLRMIMSPAIATALLTGVIPTKSARTTACDKEPTRMSQRLSMRSDRRPEKNDVRPQTNAAGNSEFALTPCPDQPA